MNDIQRWIRQYDRLRTNHDGSRANELWHSTKYDLENMSWNEIRGIYIPELEMYFGPVCETLRKSWYAYKMLGKKGGSS